jgi:hypothetical protein
MRDVLRTHVTEDMLEINRRSGLSGTPAAG